MRHCTIFLTLLLTSILCGLPSYGQPVRRITYQEAINIALQDSYTVKYFKQDMEASHFAYLATKAEFKPFLNINTFTPSWSESLTSISQADGLPVYNSTGTIQAGGNLDFTYVLPTGGNFALSSNMYWENYRTRLSEKNDMELKRNQVYSRFALSFSQPVFTANVLRENLKVAELGYRKTTLYFNRIQMDIVFDVTASFYNVYELAFEHDINLQRLENSKEAYRITKLKHETGNLPEGEILIAEITVAQDEARVMESKGRLETAKDQFKLLIGLGLEGDIELEAEMELHSFDIDMDRAIFEAIENRMEIKEDSLDIKLQQIEIKRAKRKRQIRGDISAYYDLTGLSTRDSGGVGRLAGSSLDNMFDRPANKGVVFTLSYPIADWGRAKQQVRREHARLIQRELDLDNRIRGIEREIREIVRSVYESERRYDINRRNREIALQSYRISRLRFENGDMTSQELSIEQERLSDVQLSYIDSYITYRLSVANLNRKTMYDFENKRSFLPENIK